MYNKKILLGLLLWVFGYYATAQQNIFNVPSVEVTLPGKIFFQQQVNFGHAIQSNTTFDYGLKRHMEIGFNVLNVDYSTSKKRFVVNPEKDTVTASGYSPLLMLNYLKQWQLSESVKIGAGTQMGANIPIYGDAKFVGFYYLSSSCSFFKDHLKTDAGIFYGNRFILGTGYTPGIMLGYEWSILHDKVHLTGDWLSGAHDMGEAVIGFVIYPEKAIPLSFGYQIPNSSAGSSAFVFEVTYVQSHRKPKVKPSE